MATTTWGLANVDYDVSDGFCHTAHWTVIQIDGEYSSSSCGANSLTKPETLTNRTDLKTADIIADVKAVLGADQVKAIEDGLTAKVAEQKTPTKGSFVPSS
tara:strand:+ start:342 stop:644 length:303 start_codon:yes stop_codon:yes gene_type:complete